MVFNLNWLYLHFFKAQIAIAADAPINTLLLLLATFTRNSVHDFNL
jgi:hypothetical protein